MLNRIASSINLVSFKRVPMRLLVLSVLASAIILVGSVIMGQPMYMIAILTTLPLIPVLAFEGLWKVQHYNIIAVFMIITILQVGHLGEHVTQVMQLGVFEGTLACPPPIDNADLAAAGVAAGVRSADSAPTGIWTQRVVAPDKATGLPKVNAAGNTITGPAACGVLGRLDVEIVHLIWDTVGWLLTLWLLSKFPHSKWLWLSMAVASWHTVEHFFISYVFFFDQEALYHGAKQLWATSVDGKIVTAHPVGLKKLLVNFYGAGGKNGILGRGGLFEMLMYGQATWLPTRPYLHFGYNFIITMPLVFAFITEMRNVYDTYLKRALPNLSQDQLVVATTKLRPSTFKDGDVIIKQGDPAKNFYVLVKGYVDVLLDDEAGGSKKIDRLNPGSYFGEMGLLENATRNATVVASGNAEVMTLPGETFTDLLATSEMSNKEVAELMKDRSRNVYLGTFGHSATA